jgi:uncharacterized protein (DUF488 family)
MTNTYTIGFTEKTAKTFFSLLQNAGVTRLLDVRLNNTSQLSGFAKRDDLKFFLKEIGNIEYLELQDLMPEKSLLKDYQNKLISWDVYAKKYIDILDTRNVQKKLDLDLFRNGCLLCSEHKPHQCHRRLAIEYLNSNWNPNFTIKHLF